MPRSPTTILLACCSILLLATIYYAARRPAPPLAKPLTELAPAPPAPARARKASSSDSVRGEPCGNFYQFVCGRRGIIQDPTGVVEPDIKGEVEALRLYEKLLHEHSGPSENVDEAIAAQLYTPRRRKHLNEVFEWVRGAMIRLIQSQPVSVFSPLAKSELVNALKATVLELPPPASLYKDELDVLTKNDVFYETLADGRRVIRVGGAYVLTAKSWFNRVFTFAHELAHAVDPCDADPGAAYREEYAKLDSCFHRVGFIKTQPPIHCGAGSKLSETFADWIGVQVTAEAIKQFTPRFHSDEDATNSVINSVRDLCNEESWLAANTDTYPEPQIRIEDIFGHHPVIRQILGCAPAEKGSTYARQISTREPAYCTFGGDGGNRN